MFSAYVKAFHQYPDIVVSFLEPSAELINSCHFVVRASSIAAFVMLVTYTKSGVRLSCSEFEDLRWPPGRFLGDNIRSLVEQHNRTIAHEVGNHTVRNVYSGGPPHLLVSSNIRRPQLLL